jgi:spore maturation protein CgeB
MTTTELRSSSPEPGRAGAPVRVLVVGPIYGGSLPVARYCAAAFERLGHQVAFMDCSRHEPLLNHIQTLFKDPTTLNQAKAALIGFLSKLALAHAAEFKPQLVFALAQAPLDIAAVSALRARGILTAFWFVENYRLFHYWRQTAPAYDFFFTIQKGTFLQELEALGVSHCRYVPTGCDPVMHRPLELSVSERAQYGSDVSFAGAAYPNRVATFEALIDFNFKLWGLFWESSPLLQPLIQKAGRPFTTEEMLKVFSASAISLNLHSYNDSACIDPYADFFNPRLFELAACEAFQLTDERPGLEEMFVVGREIVTFKDPADLRRKVAFYLAHPDERKEIAHRARERALRDHTYDRRLAEMLTYMHAHAGDRLAAGSDNRIATIAAIPSDMAIDPQLRALLNACPPQTPLTVKGVVSALKIALGSPQNLADPQAILLLLAEIAGQERP